jgi:hypothetical protein
MTNQSQRIVTKPCHLCGHGLPIYSSRAGRLCAICRKCPTCGSRDLSYASETVICNNCGNEWDSHKTLEAEVIKTYKVKCSKCSQVIGHQVLQLEAKLCSNHLACPGCGAVDCLVKTTPEPMKVVYNCSHCTWTGSARSIEESLRPKGFNLLR